MIKIFNTDENTMELMQIKELKVGSWINIIKPDQNDIDNLNNMIGIDFNFIANILQDDEQPMIDVRSDLGLKMIFVDAPIKVNSKIIKAIPLLIIFVRDDYIITVSNEETEVLKAFKSGIIKNLY